jgi:hypothetical protein
MSWKAFRTKFRVTGGFKKHILSPRRYQKAGTSSLKRVSGRIFTLEK